LKCFVGSAGHKTLRKVFDIERFCNLGSIFIIKNFEGESRLHMRLIEKKTKIENLSL
jgi:hypothetical protein